MEKSMKAKSNAPVENQLVSLAQARLLKQHGFSWGCREYYLLPGGALLTSKAPCNHNRPPQAHLAFRSARYGLLPPDQLEKERQAAEQRVSAPSIRRACIWYDGLYNPEYRSEYTNEVVRVSTFRLDFLQQQHAGHQEKKSGSKCHIINT
jgi:hypothetical protein